MPERLCPVDESATTRAPLPSASSGHSRLASAKCPRWLVANCASQPGPTRVSGEAMIAALLMRMSTLRPPSSTRSAKPAHALEVAEVELVDPHALGARQHLGRVLRPPRRD